MTLQSCYFATKGQIKPKADWRAIDSPKKRTKEFVCFFAAKSNKQKTNKTNLFVRPFFRRIYGEPICLRFYLIFSDLKFFENS